MADTYTATFSVTGAGVSVSGSSAQTGGAQAVLNEALGAMQTNVLYNIAFPQASVKSLILLSDVAATIKTNSSGSPADTIALAAGKPIVWDAASPYACPFTADVTKFYVTNTAAGTLKVYVLFDPTP